MSSRQPLQQPLTRATYDALLQILSQERDWMRDTRDCLLEMRRCAVTGDHPALDAALRNQVELCAAREELSVRRTTILAQAADQAGLAQRPATLAAVAARLSSQARQPILLVRRDLLSGARRIQALSAGALAILAQQRQIVDGILGDILGAAPSEARYTADGQRNDPSARALVECRS